MQKSVVTLILLLLIAGYGEIAAQSTLSGRIADAETGEPLPAAHVIIKDTYKGTISNEDGEFSLMVRELPVTLVVRFIGFESQEKTVKENSGPVDFLLKPSVAEMGEIVVTGEDPAIAIMREVIRRKQIWRENLNTYKAEAYTRQQLKNDTSIISISESISIAYWDKKRGSREVLKSKRQTANMDEAANFAGVSYLPNFYDDNLDVAGFDVVGITHPNALSYYDFSLEDIQALDGQVVYELSVSSKRKLQPLFEGTIFVLGEEYALLEVDLKPNSVVVFPPPIQDFNLSYTQQFSNFGGDFWLPVDVRIEGLVEVGVVGLRFPPIGFKQVAKLNEYEVNIPLPDTLFKSREMLSVDSTTIHSGDSLFISEVDVIPLDNEEQKAYETLDSTATLEKAFRPKGFFTRFIDWEEEDNSGGSGSGSSGSGNRNGSSSGNSASSGSSLFNKLTRDLSILGRFNRVDAFYGGLKHERRYIDNRVTSEVFTGYSTGYDDGTFSYGGKLVWRPLKNTRRFSVFSGYSAETETRYNSDMFNPVMTSVTSLMGYIDYFDYYRNEGIEVGAAQFMRGYGTLSLRYSYEDHSSINFKTNYDLFGRTLNQRPNSYVNEGRLSAIEVSLQNGNDKKALGAIGADDYLFSIEHSAKFMGSSWDYTRFKIDLYRRVETFYQRRFFPNTFDMRLNAGTYLGDLPIQKNEVLDVAQGIFTPFGAFRAKRFLPYEGASYVALNAEHNFKSVPLEMLGWRNATQTGLSIIAFGGIGKTWVQQEQANEFNNRYGFGPNTTEDWHIEAGLSLSNIFNLFRADVAYRIDDPGIYLGISIARFF
ncbi:MAG: carboxypeptidase-like regulatory domain-containing protein [Gracilimonas sp.]|uniref:DUF5686 and carboxypeptidase-like regulatory domain-containing protein n=1 Tax=Gracilimonas sp. TaxID=1974203 RepID=UPI00198B3A6B|nr:DUF5686 and carboxypeptidase-like regulatory domain-containing protein [Gracilimonas sp.]MBD3617516.1 carboxypeptidase-like regulatory domain-containing protein [Gracilimonas sp.]